MTYQMTMLQQWLAIGATIVIIEIVLIPVIMISSRGTSIAKAVFWAMVIMIAALVLCLDDVDAMPTECAEYVEIVGIEEDGDMNRVYQVVVRPFVIDNPTDSIVESFGRCVFELIGDSPSMAAVEIVNRGWVPSKWRYIEIHKAMLLANIDQSDYWEAAYDIDYDD